MLAEQDLQATVDRRRLDRNGNRVLPSVSVVIPALNEERNLPHVLEQLAPTSYEIVVVDGNSVDCTYQVAQEVLPRAVMVQQPGQGKGDALRAGFAAARGDAIVMLDADGSMQPAEIPMYLERLQDGNELVKGSRFLPLAGSEDLTPLRRFGAIGLRTAFNLLYGAKHTDLCYGFAAFWRRCLPSLAYENNGFEVETMLNIRAVKSGLRVAEVPSYELSRRHGNSNLSIFRDGWAILRVLMGELGDTAGVMELPDFELRELAASVTTAPAQLSNAPRT